MPLPVTRKDVSGGLPPTDVIRKDPAIAHVNTFVGSGNGGSIFIALKPLGTSCKESPTCNVRTTNAMDVISRLRPQLARLPVASAFLQPTQDLRIGGRGGNALYQYTLQCDSFTDLAHWGPILQQNMKTLPGITDVNSDQQNGGLEEMLTIDRTTAARLGQTPLTIDSSLYSAFGQSQVSVIHGTLNQYYVVMEVAPQYWQDPSGLKNIYVASNRANNVAGMNKMAPLSSLFSAKTSTTPLQVNHTGLFPSVTVSFNMANGMSATSDATREVARWSREPGHARHDSRLLRRHRPGLSSSHSPQNRS